MGPEATPGTGARHRQSAPGRRQFATRTWRRGAAQKRVLVVESQPEVAVLLRMLFEQSGRWRVLGQTVDGPGGRATARSKRSSSGTCRFRGALGAARRRAPIRFFAPETCARAGLAGRLVHDFRRTAVRNLERAGVPRSVAMKMVGHKTEAIYRRYAPRRRGGPAGGGREAGGPARRDRRGATHRRADRRGEDGHGTDTNPVAAPPAAPYVSRCVGTEKRGGAGRNRTDA